MFSKLALVVAATMAVFAVATPVPGGQPGVCHTGYIACCDDVQDRQSAKVTEIIGLLNLDASDITGSVGLHCSPINVIAGGAGAKCEAKPVCCEKNNFNGLVVSGCSPIDINLFH
ncbi:hypothetical protein AX16_002181 [Volvariella volvacea WC 439]|nr:hypothetical protein AX16_002181 [Volvariella volvacea WC 439]